MLTFQVNFNSEVYVTNKNAAKEMTKHISCDCKCKCNSTTYISNQIWNNKTCQNKCKSIVNTAVITFDEILSAIHIVSRKKTNNIAKNLTKNYQSKKVRHKIDCYILHTVLLSIILLLIIITICYHYAKQKDINVLTK